MRRGVVAGGLLFAVAFAATNRAVKHATAGVDASIIGAKLHELGRSEAAYDALFVGNSFVYRQVDPELFDEVASARGVQLRSYNMGASNMSFPELDYVIRQALELPSADWAFVFIDISFAWRIRAENFSTGRIASWHDARAARLATQIDLREADGSWTALATVGRHAELFGANMTNRGRGADWLRATFLEGSDWRTRLEQHQRGFRALSRGEGKLIARRNDDFNARLPEYEARVAQLTAGVPKRIGYSSFQEQLMLDLIETIEASGARPVFYMPPKLEDRVIFLSRDATRAEWRPLIFNSPQRFPALYAAANRFDADHVNAQGARLFTRRLARTFCERLGRQ